MNTISLKSQSPQGRSVILMYKFLKLNAVCCVTDVDLQVNLIPVGKRLTVVSNCYIISLCSSIHSITFQA